MKQQLLLEEMRSNRENSFGIIYKNYYGPIEHHVLRNSGSIDDAQDLFQDVMIVLIKQLDKKDFVLRVKLGTYVMAIAKNLWLKKLRDSTSNESFSVKHEQLLSNEMSVTFEKETGYAQQLKRLFKKITSHCNRLLHDIYYTTKSILQIQQEYGYTTKHNAHNQKHKCIQQLRHLKNQA